MRLALLLAFLLAALPAHAQDLDDDDGGRGFLTSRIEGLLSGAGRDVRIEGFSGALSSRATIDRLTIADDEGVWLTIEDAVFDWDRSALFNRRVEIEELSAGRIALARLPQGDDSPAPPRATAREFALPELPVAIDIGQLAVERVELGEPILGQPAVLTLEGSGRLSDGTADVTLEARRIDDAEGVFSVMAAFDPEGAGLDVDIALEEGEGGIAATALGIPDEPAIALDAQAQGVPSDLSAEFSLATAGSENLSGTFSFADAEGGRRFALAAQGDVAPLVGPAYRDFFGNDLGVDVEGSQTEAGGFELTTLSVEAAEISLQGQASIAPGGLPEAFDVALTIRDGAEGVRLPVGGDVRLGAAELTATFDASEGEVWSLEGTLQDLRTEALDVGSVRLDGGGRISTEAPRRVTAVATATAGGFEAEDQGLIEALGGQIELMADLTWSEGEPVDLRGLMLDGAGLSVRASGMVDGTTFDGDLAADVADLAQFNALTGQELGGALSARVEGEVSPLSGAFDARITGTGRDLETGIETADALIGGEAELALDAARDVEGTTIRTFTIETAALRAEVEGRVVPDALDESLNLTYSARVDDLGRVVEQVSGPATLEGTVRREGLLTPPEDPEDIPEGAAPGRWVATLDAEAPEQGTVVLSATVPDEGTAEVEFDADVADLEPYVAQLPGPARIVGRATREEGDWEARLDAELPQEIEALISATYTEEGALSANFDAGLADLGVFVEQLPGEARITGRATRDAETGAIEAIASADLPEGIEAQLDADFDAEGEGTADFDATVADLGIFVEQLPGEARFVGTATRDADGITADFDLTAPEGITAAVDATVPNEGEAVADFDARIADLGLFVEQLPGEARLTGTATRDDDGIEAQFDLAAPEGITADVDATVPNEGATVVEFDAEVPEVGAFTEAVSGAATLTGTAVQEDGETVVDADVAGPEGVTATLAATLMDDTIRADIDAQVPEVGAFVDALEGPATLDATVVRAGGETTANLVLDGPQGIEAQVDAAIPEEGPITADYDATVADISVFAPLPEGPAAVRGTATRTPEGDLSTDASLTAPAGIAADVTASLLASGDIEADLDATIAEPGAIREGLPGPIEATVTASRRAGAWSADADVTAPGDTRLAADVMLPPEGDAAIDFELMLADPSPYLNGLPGPLRAQGSARRDPEGWTGELRASAEDGSRITADGTIPDEGRAEVTFDAAVGDLGRFVPQLPGEATARGTATRQDGTWRARADVTAPAGIEGTFEGSYAEDGDLEASFDAGIGDLGRFVPQLPGEAQAQGTVSRTDGAFGFDVDATGPAGTRADLQGTYDPTGPADVDFDVTLGNVGVFVDRLEGPVSAQGSVTSDGGPLAIDASVTGPAGSQTQVSGTLPRDFQTADLTLAGTVPLEIANPFIRPRALDGTARFNLRLSGPLELSSLTGTVTAADARVALPDQRIAIEGIDLEARLTGDQAVIDVTGELSSGGRLAVAGTVGVNPPFPADLTVTGSDLVISDPALYETTADLQLAITGPLQGREGLVTGTVALGETEIRIPSTGLGGSGAIPVIEHRNAPLAVRVTRERARLADVAPATRRGTPQRNSFNLDLQILAENRIFIRGRGLDAELGGALRLTGSTANVIPVGQFDLIRGRLDLLGQRFDFNEGSIALQGEFIPVVRLVAITETDDDTLSIILEGELTDPELRIVSSAGLPQDEAIARLLFGRDLRELSPLQAARLAAAVAELSGRGGGGVFNSLREGVGLDDLDITSSEDGTIGLRAGAYLTENIYTDLSIDEDGQTEIQLNLDLTDEITVQGRTSASGETGLGVFFERDY